MQKHSKNILPILKQGLYRFSLFLLLFLSLFIYINSLADFTSIPRLPQMSGKFLMILLLFSGSLIVTFLLLFLHRLLGRLSLKNHRMILLLAAAAAVCLQLGLLAVLKPVLRYDHLKIFDEALGVLRTGELSLTAHEGYFGYYPFNIPITMLHAAIFRVFALLGIGEAHFMLLLQFVYALSIDSAVAASYLIVKKLRNERTALLLLLICLPHPILYVCASGCYTTTLMIPLLMWTLLLIISFLTEKHPRRKLLFGFLLGAFVVFSVKIRATILITVIAFVGYLIVHAKNEFTVFKDRRQIAALAAALAAGGLLCFGGCFAIEKTYVKGDYTNSQLPPAYYFMFAANPYALGHYNDADFEIITQYETLEEKREISFRLLRERLQQLGVSGTAKLAGIKLNGTWADGTEDYAEFLANVRNYGSLHDLIAGNRSDFFALYYHFYHLAMMGMLLLCILRFLIKYPHCTTPYYIILLNLLGGMLFHVLWESGYAYSISFLPLMLIAASDGLGFLSAQPVWEKRASVPLAFALAALPQVLFLLPHMTQLLRQPEGARNYAVVQDMYDGNDLLPLQKGEAVAQTFCTDKPFTHIAVRALNEDQESNNSFYVLQLIAEDGTELASRTFGGTEIMNKDYCYLKFPQITPQGTTNYTIHITALETDEENYLIFPYYHSGNYDIYTDGTMSGPGSDPRSDLNFLVFSTVPKK